MRSSMPVSRWLSCSTLGWSTWRPLKARSWRASAAPRWPTFSISRRFLRAGSSPGSRRSASSVSQAMAVSRLLKTWAMPPASRPMASMLCA